MARARGTQAPAREDLFAAVEPESVRRLLQSALDQFSTVGYHATTTRDISTGASLSAAALYVHYPSKEDLLFHVSRIAHEGALVAVTGAVASVADGGARARMEAVSREFTRWHLHHVALARVAQYELAALAPAHYDEVVAIRRQTQRIVEEEIERGARSGELDVPDLAGATRAVLALSVDVVRWYRPGGRPSADAVATSTATLALRMLGCRAPG